MGKKREIYLLFIVSLPFVLFYVGNFINLQPKDIVVTPQAKMNACFVILCRNSDLTGIKFSLGSLQKNFNDQFDYPFVFLNDSEFTDEFKSAVTAMTRSKVEFGLIPKEHWSYPSNIDKDKAERKRKEMIKSDVIYGGSESYRFMCRYFSGFFYKHELLQKYEWYWRVEPDIEFYCPIKYDPFALLNQENKLYGFVMSLIEVTETIPTLWNVTKQFIKENPDLIPKENSLDFLVKNAGWYSKCHFWSNFEIASLNFFRTKEYEKYFQHLELNGGFFYERWGDAPVHSIAVGLFLKKEEIHYFENIGYRHESLFHCPIGRTDCNCNTNESYDKNSGACAIRYKMFSP